jgi:predicted membrane channel-forming protein YqfA (hemolysin III family)
MLIAIVLFIVGVVFMVDGLDDKNDYLRFSHGMWHLSISAFSWFAFHGVDVSLKVREINMEISDTPDL